MKNIPVALACLLLLTSCGRSKSPQYYVLTPLTATTNAQHHHLHIGMDGVKIPDYLNKPQLTIYCSPQQSRLDENNLWAEELSANIKRVLKTNLSLLLPGAVIENAPWSTAFHPDYQLQVDITDFKVTLAGKSVLQGNYLIYNKEQLLSNHRIALVQTIPTVDPCTLVESMNNNLTRLSREIASKFRAYP